MPLIEIGVPAFCIWVVIVLRNQQSRKNGRIVNSVRPRPAGKQFKILGKAFGNGEGESAIQGISCGSLRIHVAPWNLHTRKTGRKSSRLRKAHKCVVSAGDKARKRRIRT